MSAGFNASGSMPAWLMSDSRRGEPEASTNLGRPIMGAALTSEAKRERVRTARKVAEVDCYHNMRRSHPASLLSYPPPCGKSRPPERREGGRGGGPPRHHC